MALGRDMGVVGGRLTVWWWVIVLEVGLDGLVLFIELCQVGYGDPLVSSGVLWRIQLLDSRTRSFTIYTSKYFLTIGPKP